jgi:uncharacterized membrane protein (UPF0127 family)
MSCLARGLAAAAFLLGCQASFGKDAGTAPVAVRHSTDPAAPDYQAPPLPRARVTVTDAYGGKHPVQVEVAATASSRERGLMWRKELSDGTGMLFIFPREQPLSFWMRNTLIPLDMLFIGKDLRVTGVVENAEPLTMSPRGVGGVSLYVLEVPGGWSARAGVKAGGKVELEGADGVEVKP